MSFIPKNPLNIPEIGTTPPLPMPGTRGLFAKEDGWYDIDSDGNIRKLGQGGGTSGGEGLEEVIEELNALKKTVALLYSKSTVKTVDITLLSSAWGEDGVNRYSQTITVEGATQYSKIDLQPTPEQLTIFYEKDVAFVTENDDGVIIVYCIGQKPTNDYIIQATITEVEIDE